MPVPPRNSIRGDSWHAELLTCAELNHEQAFVVAMSCPFRPGYGEITEPAQTRCEALDKNGIA